MEPHSANLSDNEGKLMNLKAEQHKLANRNNDKTLKTKQIQPWGHVGQQQSVNIFVIKVPGRGEIQD